MSEARSQTAVCEQVERTESGLDLIDIKELTERNELDNEFIVWTSY